ncbi:MAG: restriction endonuclease subunit S [Bacteroides sp.]|uniref:restriction endonuclease subunit S n=1 Tax=Bacteroides sp. TaxID=29523 RepID=UPI001B6EC115|nr:restriction endonuclease subunit S [Bacteroides sp.]MBP6067855.1 restriction endonuclease subunit S [Bacteroides sp.]
MKFGLEVQVIENIISVLEQHPKVDKAFVFGSRAKGNYRPDSDIDIAIKGNEITTDDIITISVAIEAKGVTHKFDLIDYNNIKEPALKEHIDRVGIEFYSRWKASKLGILCSKIGSGATPTGGSQAYKATGISLIRSQNILDFKFNYDGLAFIDEEQAFALKNVTVLENDILLNITGDSVARVCKVPKEVLPARVNQHVAILRTKGEKLNNDFLLYQLQAKKESLLNLSEIGGTRNALTKLMIENFEIDLPPLPEQTAIASILCSLDNKIDLLHRQNKTLEQLAETLFRQWFVEEAEESWEVGTLDDIISVKGGTTPSTVKSEYWNGNINWTSPRDLSNATSIFLLNTERKITEKGLAQIGSGLLPIGTVLLSSRAPIGYLTITEIPVAINQGYIAIVCDKIVSNYFIYLWCKANMETIENAGNGSVFQEISKTSFKGLEVIVPSKMKLNHFDKEIEPIFRKIKSNQTQIRTLTKTRDTLLPKLMSGEMRVEMQKKEN